MRGIHVFMFFVALPAIIFLCHDVYLFYMAQGAPADPAVLTKIYTEDAPSKAFDFAALGFIWLNYSPDSYQWFGDSMEPDEWASVKAFLTFKAFYVACAFAGVVYALIGAIMLARMVGRKTKKFAGKGRPISPYKK